MEATRKRHLSSTQIIVFGFMAGILIGAFLLALPISSADGEWTNFVDSLFTATSSLCVTGLTTLTTADHWSFFGKLVILFLIQFGGLGVVTFTTAIFLIMRKRITLKDRIRIQDSFNLNTLQGLVRLIIWILKGTLLVEGIAAILFCFQFIPQFGLFKGIGNAVFTSVSAFCNAGIDLIGAESLIPYQGNVLVNFVTMGLIILGGLGFPVWLDLMYVGKMKEKRKIGIKGLVHKFQLHTKLVLITTGIFIFGGAIIILILEWNNGKTLGSLPWWEKGMVAMFQSVTTRTAGFMTVPQGDLTGGSSFFCILLMFVGGSPSGTAGGIKTITIAIMLLAVISVIRGKEDTEVFGRKITEDNVKKAMAVFMISLSVLIASTMILSIIESAPFLDILYETASALATVGLSRGMTSTLTEAGKIALILTMYLGRIGPMTMALSFNTKKPKMNAKHLPSEKVIVG